MEITSLATKSYALLAGNGMPCTPATQMPTAMTCCMGCVRFWHDEKRFRGTGDVSLAQHMLFAAGGTRTGGQFKDAVAQGSMGWQQPHM